MLSATFALRFLLYAQVLEPLCVVGKSAFKDLGAEISLAGVCEDGDNCLALAEMLSEAECGCDVATAGYSAEYTFLTYEAAGSVESLLVGDYCNIRENIEVEILWDKTVSDSHLQMCTDASA